MSGLTPHQIKENFINSDMPVEEYHEQLSKEGYNKMREEAQEIEAPLSVSILARSKKTKMVTISSVGDGKDLEIEIRVMLNKREVEIQSKFFKAMKHIQYVDDDYYYWIAGSFLDMICIDPELDMEFWRRDDVDPYIIQELIAAFIKGYK